MAAERDGRRLRPGWLAAAAGAALCLPLSPRAAADGSAAHEMKDMRWGTTAFALAEVLEYGPVGGDERPIRYDLVGWVGGAVNRVWLKADGEQSTTGSDGAADLQLLYGRLVAPFWDLQAGLRLDALYGDHHGDEGGSLRPHVALGLEGLAPGWFEVEPTLFVSLEGDVSARLTLSYDLLLTQRLVLQPRVEAGAAVQDVPERQVGSGLNEVEAGLRLRYELWRELAPYLGVTWDRRFGKTAELVGARAARADGPAGEVLVVAGLRLWR